MHHDRVSAQFDVGVLLEELQLAVMAGCQDVFPF